MPTPPRRRTLTIQDLADIRGALDRAQDFARAHGDDFRDYFVSLLARRAVMDRHVPATRGEAERERAPDAAGGAGNQHDARRFRRAGGGVVHRGGHLQCGDESESSPTR